MKLLIIDDHPCVRASLALMLSSSLGVQITGEVGSLEQGMRSIGRVKPDLALLDMVLPDGKAPASLRKLRNAAEGLGIIVFTGSTNEEMILRTLDDRPQGFFHKTSETDCILECVAAVAKGGTYYCRVASALWKRREKLRSALTEREVEVLRLIAAGYSSKEAGMCLGLGTRTIEAYRAALMSKLKVRELASLIRIAIKMGLVDLEQPVG